MRNSDRTDALLSEIRDALERHVGRYASVTAIGLGSTGEVDKKYTAIWLAVLNALQIQSTEEAREIELINKAGRAPRIVLGGHFKSVAQQKNLSQWHVSLTHDGPLTVALALGLSEGSPIKGVGLDLTYMDRIRKIVGKPGGAETFRKKICHEAERALLDGPEPLETHFARLWALKEAAYKALPDPKPHFSKCLKQIVVSGSTADPSITVESPLDRLPFKPDFLTCLVQQEDLFLASNLLVEAHPSINHDLRSR